MTRLETLQKENQALRNEIAVLKESLQKVSKDLSSKTKSQNGRQTDKKELSPDRANSVEFMSSKYDELYFKRKLISRFKISLLKLIRYRENVNVLRNLLKNRNLIAINITSRLSVTSSS